MSASDFRHLMSRFYEAATDVLIENDALLDKFVGDQAIGLFVPGIAGPEHARRAIDAAQTLLQRTGHRSGEDPWLQLGAAVHTGPAYVGTVFSRGEISDFTALGDTVNVTAHLCSQAGVGEILVTESAPISARPAGRATRGATALPKGLPDDGPGPHRWVTLVGG